MGESLIHLQLVGRIAAHVRSEFPYGNVCALYDLPETSSCDKPPMIEGHRPDFFAEDTPPSFTLIGEAKTADDLETKHSKMQFRVYLSYLRIRPNPHLVVATPWYVVNSARSLLAAAQREMDADLVKVAFIH